MYFCLFYFQRHYFKYPRNAANFIRWDREFFMVSKWFVKFRKCSSQDCIFFLTWSNVQATCRCRPRAGAAGRWRTRGGWSAGSPRSTKEAEDRWPAAGRSSWSARPGIPALSERTQLKTETIGEFKVSAAGSLTVFGFR